MRKPAPFSMALLAAAIAAGCREARTSLVEKLEPAGVSSPEGLYASFVESRSDRGLVRLADDSRPSLTPPFPATLRFDVTLPESAFLSFAPALVAQQEVRRAAVEFVVRVESGGEQSVVFEEFFDFEDLNRWHDRELDLSAWSGRDVTLFLETRAPGGRAGKLWADRLQTVWGDPVIASNQPGAFAGFASGEAARLLGFAVNLLIGGFLALAIRELYVRYGSTANDRPKFGNLFPLFTFATIVLITVVQASIPLSLGLLGALSIVRFRSAIKTPEELVYLLLCVSVGLALGAEHRLLAASAVCLVAGFVLLRGRFGSAALERSFLLSISGEGSGFIDHDVATLLDRVRGLVGSLQFQRLDQEGGRVELRTVVSVGQNEVENLLVRLREALPGLDVACVETDAVL